MTQAKSEGHSRRQVLTLAGAAALLVPGVAARAAGTLTYITPQGIAAGLGGGVSSLRRAASSRSAGSGGEDRRRRQFAPGGATGALGSGGLSGAPPGSPCLSAVAKGGPIKSIATICHDSPFYMISVAGKPVMGPPRPRRRHGRPHLAERAIGKHPRCDAAGGEHRPQIRDAPIYRRQSGRLRSGRGRTDQGLHGRHRHLPSGQGQPSRTSSPSTPANTCRCRARSIWRPTRSIADDAATLTAFLGGVKDAIAFVQADAGLKETLRLCRTFPIEGAGNNEAALGILKENLALWLSAGPQNVLRNVPENWSKGVDLAVRAGFGQSVRQRQAVHQRAGRSSLMEGAVAAGLRPQMVLRDVGKTYKTGSGDTVALTHVDLEIGAGEIVVLLGPSGLREKHVAAHRRRGWRPPPTAIGRKASGSGKQPTLGVVFQDANLFPWFRVADNIALPLAAGRHAAAGQRRERATDARPTGRPCRVSSSAIRTNCLAVCASGPRSPARSAPIPTWC